MLIKILTFSFMKMRLKMSTAKWHPFCLGLNVLNLSRLSRWSVRYNSLFFQWNPTAVETGIFSTVTHPNHPSYTWYQIHVQRSWALFDHRKNQILSFERLPFYLCLDVLSNQSKTAVAASSSGDHSTGNHFGGLVMCGIACIMTLNVTA